MGLPDSDLVWKLYKTISLSVKKRSRIPASKSAKNRMDLQPASAGGNISYINPQWWLTDANFRGVLILKVAVLWKINLKIWRVCLFSADKQNCQSIELQKYFMKRYRFIENERILIILFVFHNDRLMLFML